MLAKSGVYNKIAIYCMLSVGVVLIVGSAFFASSFLVIAGLALMFWAVILQYLMPVKHVPLSFLVAVAKSSMENIERILIESNLTQKAVYLSLKNHGNIYSGLIFIPKAEDTSLSAVSGNLSKLASNSKGVFLTPPGLAFSQLIEQECHVSFVGLDFKSLNSKLSVVFVQNLSILKDFKMTQTLGKITVEITDSLLNEVCRESGNQPRTHSQVGCLLSSALACILAKTTGKPVTIQSETVDVNTKVSTIVYTVED